MNKSEPPNDAAAGDSKSLPAAAAYTPRLSAAATDETKLYERELKVHAREIEAMSVPPGVPVPGQGPPVDFALDIEFVEAPAGDAVNVTSVQLYVVGECGEFVHIHYPGGPARSDRPSFDRLITDVLLMAMEAGAVLEWPRYVTVAAFFLRVDLTGFRDLARFKNKLDAVGRSVGTRGPGIPFNVEFEPRDIERLTRTRRIVADDGARLRVLLVRFIDLVRHTPPGTSLADVGRLLGHEKVELPDGAIKRMDRLLAEDPELYTLYAEQDVRIPAYFLRRLRETIKRLLGKEKMPLTVSGVSVSWFKRELRRSGFKFDAVFGRHRVKRTMWDDEEGTLRTVGESVPVDMRSIHAEFVTRTAHGGRGECMYVGPTPLGVWNDIDVASAYTVVLSMIGLIDWERPFVCLDVRRFVGHVMGFLLIEFRHSAHVRFPVFAVEGADENLFFPRAGRAYCTAAEIEAALHIDPDVEIKVLHGVIYPWLDENRRAFEPFVLAVRDERAKHEKGSFDEQYAKLAGNSLFGRTGMGLVRKMAFHAGKMESVELEPDEMTNEVFFSFTMGYTRALLAELMNSLPPGRRVVSVTTDGFLTDASLDEVDQTGPLATRFRAATDRVAPPNKRAVLEIKHQTRQIVSARVRAQFTGVVDPGVAEDKRVVLAKGNVTPEIVLPDGPVSKEMIKALQNAALLDIYLNRTPESKTMMRPFISVRQQWIDDLDVFRVERPVRLNLEFDWKRKAVAPRMESVGEGVTARGEHIAFDSEPWDNVAEAERMRTLFNEWRKRRCLTSIEAWNDLMGYVEGTTKRRKIRSASSPGINRTAEGEVGVLRRMFLRALTRGAWGARTEMSYTEVAVWLTTAGYPTSVTELKNARRAALVENAVAATPEVLALVAVLVAEFPDLEVAKFIGDGGGCVGPAGAVAV